MREAIQEQGKLTPELAAALERAATLAEVEDLYRPYQPKRRTRAGVAREKGLEPLAQLLLAGKDAQGSPLRQSRNSRILRARPLPQIHGCGNRCNLRLCNTGSGQHHYP